MTSIQPDNPIYFELWDELFKGLIEPVFKEDLYTSDPLRGLSPRLMHRNDKGLYPFIYDRVMGAMEAHCEESVLPKLLSSEGMDLISHAHYSCVKEVYLKTIKVWSPLLALEYEYLKGTNELEKHFPPLERRAGIVFRKAVYDKIADRLAEAAYGCISDDFIIREKEALNTYFELLNYVWNNEANFFEEQWNIAAHSRLIDAMNVSFKSTNKSLKEYLKCRESMLTLGRTIFPLSEGEYEKSIEQDLRVVRDNKIFGNDANDFKMILEVGDGVVMNQIYSTFGDDEEFLKRVAHQALQIFSELVHTTGHISTKDWFKQKTIFCRLFSQWLSLQKILRQGHKNEETIHQTLIDPFLTVIHSTFPGPEAIMGVLTEYCQQLFSRIYKRQTELEPDGMREIRGLLSLSSFLPSASPFHAFFRALLSKTLLEGAFALPTVEQLPDWRSFDDQTNVLPDIFSILDDAITWPLYEREMSSIIEHFGQLCGKIDVRPKILRRSVWHLERDIGLVLPHRMQLLSDTLLDHLHLWHPLRRASIHSSIGKMYITTNSWNFRGNDVKIKLTTAQGILLALFEEVDELPLNDVAQAIMKKSSKPSCFNAVVTIIKSMITEHAILLKQPQNSEFQETDLICLNMQFKPHAELITLPAPEYSNESMENMQDAMVTMMKRFKKLAMEAAVMKIMKQEREMELHQLKEMTYSNMKMKETGRRVSFETVVERLVKDEYLTVDQKIVRYVP